MIAELLVAILAVETPAPVTGAVLYSGQARLTRTAEAAVSGRTAVELPLLPREADPDSVRVEVTGAHLETVEVVRVGPFGGLAARAAEARTVLAAIERLDAELALVTGEESALQSAAETADQPPEAPPDDAEPQVWAGVDPARWRQTLAFLRGWRERLDERQARLSARSDELRRQRQQLTERAAEVVTGDEGRVRVVAHLSGQGKARVRASYLIDGPTWFPRYEVRLHPERDEVSVGLIALTAQQTGEDWRDTALTFSTALPAISTAAPELPRWLIGESDRFIPTTVVPPEPSPPAPRAPPAAPPSELSELRARLLQLPRPTTAPVKQTFDIDGFELDAVQSMPTGAEAVRQLVEPREVQSAGYGADTPGIGGFVYDQTGQPLKGVKVVAAGPGTPNKTTYTNSEGAFRFSALAAGTYEVRASAPKLKTVTQREIRVGSAPAEVNLVMEVEHPGIEEVKVVEIAPLINTSSAGITDGHNTSFVTYNQSTSSSGARRTISLAPPEATYRRPKLAPGLPAALAGGQDLTFATAVPETLTSGALAQRVLLGNWRWPVAIRRQLFPAVRAEAYLVASLRLPAATPLPAGEAALFVGAQPVGRAQLDLTRPGQPLTLPLGIDRAVRARRQVQLDTHQEGLFDKEDVSRYTVTIDVANPHRRGVALDVFDQLPRARDASVAVKLVSSTPPAKVDAEGLLTWHTGLAAGATAQLRFVYTLVRPRGHRLHQ